MFSQSVSLSRCIYVWSDIGWAVSVVVLVAATKSPVIDDLTEVQAAACKDRLSIFHPYGAPDEPAEPGTQCGGGGGAGGSQSREDSHRIGSDSVVLLIFQCSSQCGFVDLSRTNPIERTPVGLFHCATLLGSWSADRRYMPHGNIHEINTWQYPIQTQCG